MESMSTSNNSSRVLVIAHGHPDFSLGGGELAAYNVFKAMREDEGVEEAWFIARHDSGNGPTGALTLRRQNEYLWQQSMGDSFLLKAANSYAIWNDFRQMIRVLKPTVVNLHHYFHLGIELLRIIKEEDPSIRVVLTLHEYMAICHQQGQMVKRGSNKLCFRSSLEDCHRCFPEFTKEQFWLRRSFIGHHFDYVDHFVSPSYFLKQRYVDWGISAEKISVIENGQSPEPKLAPRPLSAIEEVDEVVSMNGEQTRPTHRGIKQDESVAPLKQRRPTRNRLAFFGQINPFKGIDILMHAMLSMKKSERDGFVVEIHGANFEHQADDFKTSVMQMANILMEEGSLRWVGSYEPFQVRDRMRNVDWVIIPSIWWENSPMVIQEAFVSGRPVIASDIGGMKEKITHEVNGLHFEARNPLSLAETLKRAAAMTDNEWLVLHNGIEAPLNYHDCGQFYKEIFN